jgi:DNA invertase Pin-like site-specific DNA recombinase
MQKAVGYCRVSTQGQVKDGYSLQYQREEIEKYCIRHNMELLDVFQDMGISGAKADEDTLTIEREGLQELLASIPYLGAEYVVVLNTSRLWRSDLVKVLIHRELRHNNADIRSIEQENYSIHTKDPNDFLVNGMLELLDQYQRLEIALKLGRGRRKKAQNGGYSGGRAAYGYSAKKSQKSLQVDQGQAKAVKRIFEIRECYTDMSLSKIATLVNMEGYRTAENKDFTKVQIKRVLDRHDFYEGKYFYGSVEAAGQHTAII